MKYYFVFLIFVIIGCKSSKANIELEILTKEINCLDIAEGTYKDFLFSENISPVESRTILTYKFTNNTDDTYYFNVNDMNKQNKHDYYIQIDKSFIAFSDSNNQLIPTRQRTVSENLDDDLMEYLGYNSYYYNTRNFVIHPHETLYFEWFLVLPFGTLLERTNYSLIFDKNQNYYAELFLSSDGVNYKNNISRTELKTIEENGYKVFNGVIKSKNKIPLVFKGYKK